jgi:hypothetical protein
MNTDIFNRCKIASFISSIFLILWFHSNVDFSKVKFVSDLGAITPKAISLILLGFIVFCTIQCLVELSKTEEKTWQYKYEIYILIAAALISIIVAYPKIAETFSLSESGRPDIIIPLCFAYLASILSSALAESITITKVFIKLRKSLLLRDAIEILVLLSLISLCISAIYYIYEISNITSLIVRNSIFAIGFITFFILMSPKEPVFSEEKLKWLKKKSDSLDHQVEVSNLSKSFSGENLTHPEKKLFKNVKRLIKSNHERENNSVFPRYITLKEIPFEIKNGHLYPVQDAFNGDDFVIEVMFINKIDEKILRSNKIMFKYVVMACDETPIKANKNKDENFILPISENALKLQILNEQDPSDIIVSMAESDANLSELKALIISKKIDVNHVASNGWTALLSSVANGAEETTKYLLQKAADTSLSNKHEASPLHFSSKYGNKYLSKLLIDYQADINKLDILGVTPLMMASRYGHSAIVKLLVESGADITIQDENNETAHSYAIKGNYGNIARYITENNKNKELEDSISTDEQ